MLHGGWIAWPWLIFKSFFHLSLHMNQNVLKPWMFHQLKWSFGQKPKRTQMQIIYVFGVAKKQTCISPSLVHQLWQSIEMLSTETKHQLNFTTFSRKISGKVLKCFLWKPAPPRPPNGRKQKTSVPFKRHFLWKANKQKTPPETSTEDSDEQTAGDLEAEFGFLL